MHKHILILESNPAQSAFLTEALTRIGYDAHPAPTLNAAYDLLMQYQFDVFLSAISANDQEALAFLGEVNLAFRWMPVVLMGNPQENRAAYEALGLELFLPTPVDLFSLRRLLQELIDQSDEATLAM